MRALRLVLDGHEITASSDAQADLAIDLAHLALLARPRASSGPGGLVLGTCAASSGTSVHFSNACGHRGRKWQPSGGRSSDGGEPGIVGSRWRAVRVDPRDRAQQAPGVRMLGVVEQLVERPLLDHPPGVHDHDPVGDVGDHAEVVGDEDDPGAGLLAQLAQLVQDLSLDRDVECRRRLVGDQQLRGSRTCAIAIITRWRIPPENSCG